MKKYFVSVLPVGLLAGLIVFVACSEVPDSDRKQLNFMSAADEAKLGIQQFAKIKQQLKISKNPTYNALVQRVGKKLSAVMPVEGAQWEFVVFDDPSPNAFALPGGKVGVHSGLFQVTKNEAGLAAVIGHEVAHVVARHSGERMTRGIVSAGAVALGTYLLNKEAGVDPKVAAVGLGGAAVLNYKAHSRDQELEADKLGALYMARAGYDPQESVRLWQRFADYRVRQGQNQGFSLLSTHPVDAVRIRELNGFMVEAKKEFKP